MRRVLRHGDGAVGRLWPQATVVCIASGPSLTQADVDYVRGKARVIVINNAYQLMPDADALWATDAEWYRHHDGAPSFRGLKFSLKVPGLQYPQDVHVLKNTGVSGFERDPGGVRNGKNGGHAAINLAAHLGASRIVLLGYDCQLGPKGEEHFHGRHPQGLRNGMPFKSWREHFGSLVAPLRERKIEIVNCSRQTAITAFPRRPLEAVLPQRQEIAC